MGEAHWDIILDTIGGEEPDWREEATALLESRTLDSIAIYTSESASSSWSGAITRFALPIEDANHL